MTTFLEKLRGHNPKMNCPNCKRDISIKKYAIQTCSCGKVLMEVEINKVKQIVDVTPTKEDKDEY